MPRDSLEQQKQDIFERLLRHLQQKGWNQLNLAQVAQSEDIAPEVMEAFFPAKINVLEYLIKQVDDAYSAHLPEDDADERPHDRLFAIIMARFDALAPYRGALQAVQGDMWQEPWNFLCLLPCLIPSLTSMLDAAHIDTQGLTGLVRVKIFAVAYFMLLPTWLNDESADLSATMAAVDRSLERLAQVPSFFPLT